jgi:hypothetical protein
MAPAAAGGKKDVCRLCKHDGNFRDGRLRCAHCGAGKAKALGFVPLGKGGRAESTGKGTEKPPPTANKPGQQPAAGKPRERGKKGEQIADGRDQPVAAAADAATVAAVYKELRALRAENKELRKLRAAGTQEGPPAAKARSAEPGARDDEAVRAKKQRMDVIRSQLEHLQKGGEGLDDVIKARREELERLRQEVRTAHPLDVQLRNLDCKVAGIRKQREKLDEEAKSVAGLILELKANLDKVAKAAAEKQQEEDQLAKERVELVARQNADKLAAAEAAVSGALQSESQVPDPFRGMEDLEPELKAGLQAYFARKRANGASASSPAAPAGSEKGTSEEVASAVAAAQGLRGMAVDEGTEGDKGDEAKRRKLGGEA